MDLQRSPASSGELQRLADCIHALVGRHPVVRRRDESIVSLWSLAHAVPDVASRKACVARLLALDVEAGDLLEPSANQRAPAVLWALCQSLGDAGASAYVSRHAGRLPINSFCSLVRTVFIGPTYPRCLPLRSACGHWLERRRDEALHYIEVTERLASAHPRSVDAIILDKVIFHQGVTQAHVDCVMGISGWTSLLPCVRWVTACALACGRWDVLWLMRARSPAARAMANCYASSTLFDEDLVELSAIFARVVRIQRAWRRAILRRRRMVVRVCQALGMPASVSWIVAARGVRPFIDTGRGKSKDIGGPVVEHGR